MKKLVLTMVALVAMATTSFAQYSDSSLQVAHPVYHSTCPVYHSTCPVYHTVFQAQ